MLERTNLLLCTTLGFAFHAAAAGSGATVGFCRDNTCSDCPVQITSQGEGYPDCAVYDSQQVFGMAGFEGSEVGGWEVFMDISEPAEGCAFILTTPAYVDRQLCGDPVGSYKYPVCSTATLDKTFMVNYCCGNEQCEKAGASRRDLGPSLQTLTVNGTVVEPVEVANFPDTRSRLFRPRSENLKDITRKHLNLDERDDDGICDDDWVPDSPEDASFTTQSPNRQVIISNFKDASIDITQAREVTYTESMTEGMEMGLNFQDIFSLGVSTSLTVEFSESIKDELTYHFENQDGQSGSIVFTPTLRCTKGSGHCKGERVAGTFCTGFTEGSGYAAGTWTLVVHD